MSEKPVHCVKSKKAPKVPLKDPCVLCGEKRESHEAHFPKKKSKGGTNIIHLCPTHHFLWEHGRINKDEAKKLWETMFRDVANSPEEFIDWAYNNCYPYKLNELTFWDYHSS